MLTNRPEARSEAAERSPRPPLEEAKADGGVDASEKLTSGVFAAKSTEASLVLMPRKSWKIALPNC